MLSSRDRKAAIKAVEEVQRRRAANLDLLADRAGGWRELARACGVAENLLSMMGTGKRSMTELAARKLEVALGLPLAWLDERH